MMWHYDRMYNPWFSSFRKKNGISRSRCQWMFCMCGNSKLWHGNRLKWPHPRWCAKHPSVTSGVTTTPRCLGVRTSGSMNQLILNPLRIRLYVLRRGWNIYNPMTRTSDLDHQSYNPTNFGEGSGSLGIYKILETNEETSKNLPIFWSVSSHPKFRNHFKMIPPCSSQWPFFGCLIRGPFRGEIVTSIWVIRRSLGSW